MPLCMLRVVATPHHFFDAMNFHIKILTATEAQYMHDYLPAAGVYHQTLAHNSMTAGRFFGYLIGKARYQPHGAIDLVTTRWNPRFSWVYPDEDYMGRVAQAGKAWIKARGP